MQKYLNILLNILTLLNKHIFLLVLIFPVFIAWGQEKSKWHTRTFHVEKMSSPFDIVIYTADTTGITGKVEKILTELDTAIHRINHYAEDSEINTFCRLQASGKKVGISPTLREILKLSKRAFRRSNGKFDVSAGCLIRFWKAKDERKAFPDRSFLESLRPQKPFSKLKIGKKKAKWGAEDACIDFGGIGKGYIADECLNKLKAAGYPIALVNAGGDIVAGDEKPAGKWKIGIENPEGNITGNAVFLGNKAIATSGDYYQFITIGGKRYSHIIDPVTMFPVDHRSNVTVIAEKGWEADFYASYFSILSPGEAVKTANTVKGVEVFISFMDGQTVKTIWSDGFKSFLEN